MSQPLHGEPNTWIAVESPSRDASCAESLRGRLITAASRYASIGTVLMGLAPAFDLEAVTALYNERWGSRASGVTLIARSIHDVDYHPSTRCRVTHELTLERPDEELSRTFGVVNVRPDGLDIRAFNEDPDLPWLAHATDPGEVGRELRAEGLLATFQIARVVPVRYRAGSRCLLRLDTAAGSVYLKVLASDGERIALMADALRGVPPLLQPLGYSSKLHALVLPELPGSAELHRLAFDASLPAAARLRLMRESGAALATLHAARCTSGLPRGIVDDAHDLGASTAPLAHAAPALLPRFLEGVRRLLDIGPEEGPFVASHGGFRTDQLLLVRGEPVIIDLDGLCWANPARDLGNFLAHLRWKAIREPHHARFIGAAIPGFLEGYEAVRDIPAERWRACYEAASLLKIAGRRFRKLTVSEWSLVPRLLDEAEALLRSSDRVAVAPAAIPVLPESVREALDIADMTARLRPLLDRPGGNRSPQVIRAELLSQKLGRWAIGYGATEGEPEVIGKMFKDPVLGRRSHQTMQWLWDHEFAVPRPLGFLPELSMLVYQPVPGRPLGNGLFDDRAAADMDLAAAWLAALHRSTLPLDRSFDVGNELKNLRIWAAVVGERHPDHAGAAERISKRLEELASELGAETGRPIHKDFHHEHVFVADRAHVIDLDEARLGDPTFDVAHFCAYLQLLGCRVPAMALTLGRRRDEFIAAYRCRSECDLGERYGVFYAYTCLKIAKQLCMHSGMAPRPNGEEEHCQTAAMLREGLAALNCGSEP
jgi:aminoglycoside phosphotransferase (APT) family kinase protein